MRHPQRDGKVYYFPETPDRKAIMIFDGGYEGGDIHIYEHLETVPATELQARIKHYGHNINWRVTNTGVLTKEDIREAIYKIEKLLLEAKIVVDEKHQ